MNDKYPIGIFDSGVGGLSIFQEVQNLLPQESIIYLADQKNMPYGTKTQKEIREISEKAVKFLNAQKVKLIIIACNTSTVYALEHIRSKVQTPIIGTVPVVKTIVESTRTGKVAVLSTPATAKSKYLAELVKKFADGKKVYVVGETGLEELVEASDIDNPAIRTILDKHIVPLVHKGVDSIALACTHYPFLKDQIRKAVGYKVNIFDSGGAVARQAARVLENNSALANNKKPNYKFFTTGEAKVFKTVAEKLLGIKLARVAHASL